MRNRKYYFLVGDDNMRDRLYRSGREKMIAGVCGGLSEYFDIDVTLVRLIALVTLLASGIGFIAYVVAWVIIPRNPDERWDTKRPNPSAYGPYDKTYPGGRTYNYDPPYGAGEPYGADKAHGGYGGADQNQGEGAQDTPVADDEPENSDPSGPKSNGDYIRDNIENVVYEVRSNIENVVHEIRSDWEGRKDHNQQSKGPQPADSEPFKQEPFPRHPDFTSEPAPKERGNGGKVAGIILVVLGVLFMLDRWFPFYSFDKMWPLFLVIIGFFVMFKRRS